MHEFLKEGERLDDLECGSLKIIQDKKGYTFTMDAVLIANHVRALPKEKIIDLGTGSAIIPLLLSQKTKDTKIFGVEIQERLFEMASRSVKLNNLQQRITLINADMKEISSKLGKNTFDVVVANPPYYTVSESELLNENFTENDICRREIKINLKDLVKTADSLLKYGGNFFVIIKSERFVDLICELRAFSIEPKRIIPIQPTPEKPIDTVIVEAKKCGKSGVKMEKPLIIFDENGEYTEKVRRIYRNEL